MKSHCEPRANVLELPGPRRAQQEGLAGVARHDVSVLRLKEPFASIWLTPDAQRYDKPQYKPTAGVDELVYLDPHDAPFHVFEFHYRSRGAS